MKTKSKEVMCKKSDWYYATKYSKQIILKILFIAHEMIEENQPIKTSTWLEALLKIKSKEPSFVRELQNLVWQKDIRSILRNMKAKYEKEKEHEGYLVMLEEAREIWKNCFITM